MIPYNPAFMGSGMYAGDVSDRAREHLEKMHRGDDFYREPEWPSPDVMMLLHHLMGHPPPTPAPTPHDLFLPAHKGANVDAMHHYADELEDPGYEGEYAGSACSFCGYDGAAEGYITGANGRSYMDGGYAGTPMPMPQPGLPPTGTPPATPGITYPNPPGGVNPYPDVPNMGPSAAEGFYNYLNQSATGTGGAAGLKNIEDAQARRLIDSSMAAGGLGLSGARSEAESNYQAQSDARYQQMVGNMYPTAFAMGNYGNQYGLELLNAGQYRNPQTPNQLNSPAMNLQALLQQLLGGGKPGTAGVGGGAPGGAPTGGGKNLLDTLAGLLGPSQPGMDPLAQQPGSTYADLIAQGYPPELAQLFATSGANLPGIPTGSTDPFASAYGVDTSQANYDPNWTDTGGASTDNYSTDQSGNVGIGG